MTKTATKTKPRSAKPPHSGPRVTTITTARTLREQTVGVRLSFRWMGTRRALRNDQLRRARAVFQAADGTLSASKRLFNTRHPAWRAVASARRRLVAYWRAVSLPYPESATRLLRRDWVERFEEKMGELKAEMDRCVERLSAVYAELLGEARDSLGELYEHADYPAALADEFSVSWDYPSLEPPDYLQKLKPELYEAEAARVAARFDEAIVMAEQALAAELADLVDVLAKQLARGADGKAREIKPGAVAGLRDFFDRFRELNVHGSADLDQLIERAERTIKGVGATALHGGGGVLGFAQAMAGVREQLGRMIQDRPRRRVVRGNRPAGEGQAPKPRGSGLFAAGTGDAEAPGS